MNSSEANVLSNISDQDLIGWLLKGAAALILFLLSLGIKDIRDRIRDTEKMCARLEALEERISILERIIYRGHPRTTE